MIDISAVMIVKDEERFLPQCLESLNDVMPVVIVDTGSTDNTMEIARQYGAELYEHPWRDSFSEARNHALRYVKTEYALQIDADEELIGATVGELDKLNPGCAAFMTPIHNVMRDGSIALHHFERLYRPEMVIYSGRVHNQVIVNGEIGITGLSILHHGYSLPDDEMLAKNERTLRLLEKEIMENGYTSKTVRYLIQTYRTLGRYREMLGALDNYGHLLREYPGVYQEICASGVIGHHALGDNIKAKAAGLSILEQYPEALDALFYLAIIYMDDQEWENALDHFIRYIKVRRKLQLEGCDVTVNYHSWGNLVNAFNNLGICANRLGMIDKSVLAFMRAEMLAKGRSDIAGYAANVDNSICRWIEERGITHLLPDPNWLELDR